MFAEVNEIFFARSKARLALSTVALIAMVGVVDHVTGYELSFAIFYLVPVGVASWYGGSRLGVAASVLSAATWLAVDYTSGHPYGLWAIPFWNAGTRLGFFLIVAVLIARQSEAFELQARLAQHDGLTGVMNARAFKLRFEAIGRIAVRYGHPTALGYLDLDGFKSINDRFGHGAGDRVLQEVASALLSRLRSSDCVARLGGDEFAVLLPEADLNGARVIFTDVHDRLVALAAERGWPIGFSIGVAVFRTHPANPEEAIRCADNLMYRAKTAGKTSGRSNLILEECLEEGGGRDRA